MELYDYFKSIIDNDRSAIVVCNLDHTIIYMNPSAKERYAKSGGAELIGKSLLGCHNENSSELINKITDYFKENPDKNIIYTFHNEKENKDVYTVALRDENKNLIGYYEKHEYRTPETMKKYNFE